MGCCGGHVWVTGTTKNLEMLICGVGGVDVEVRCGGGECFGGEPVDEVCGGVECLNPVDRRETRLEQKRTQNIINGTNRAFSLAILLGGVGARHAKNNTMREEERAGHGIIEFAAVVALDTLDGGAELRVHISKKIGKGWKSVRF
jgi:hypothetical protein